MTETPEVFIQFKNMDVCLDFYCSCGEQGHLDGYLGSRHLKCGDCGFVFQVPSTITLQPPEGGSWNIGSAVEIDMHQDDED